MVLMLLLGMALAACGGGEATNTPGTGAGAQNGATATTAPVGAGTDAEPTAAPTEADTAAGVTPTMEMEPTTPAEQTAAPTQESRSGGADGGNAISNLTAAQVQQLTGSIQADGSSTVGPITQAAAEDFKKRAPNVKVAVGQSGTGDGMKRFCAGETDIADASRPIKEEEAAECKKNGVQFIEIPVAFDGIAVTVNSQNTWTECLKVEELKKMWAPEAEGTVDNWSQVRQGFSETPITFFSPGSASGTFEYFVDAIIEPEDEAEEVIRGDVQASEDDNVLVQGVASDEGAIGYFGLAYYQANKEKLKLLGVDGGKGCVQATPQTVRNGTYVPLSRPLFIYVSKKSMNRPEMKEFVEYYLSPEFTKQIDTPEVGYVSLPQNLYKAIIARTAKGTAGTLFPEGAEPGENLQRFTK